MKKSLLLTASVLSFLSSVSFCQDVKIKEDEEIVRVSIRQEPYDIAAYEGKSWEELNALAIPHLGHHIFHSGPTVARVVPYTCFVDDDWRTLCNIYQALFRQQPATVFYLDNDFISKCAGIALLRIRSVDHVFFSWKQVAWVHPDYAEALAYVLTHGFQDKIAPNPEWAPYWAERAKLLRESQGWYIPPLKDADRIPPPGATMEQKLIVMLGLRETD